MCSLLHSPHRAAHLSRDDSGPLGVGVKPVGEQVRLPAQGGVEIDISGCMNVPLYTNRLCELYGEYGLILSIVNAGKNLLRAAPLGRAVECHLREDTEGEYTHGQGLHGHGFLARHHTRSCGISQGGVGGLCGGTTYHAP